MNTIPKPSLNALVRVLLDNMNVAIVDDDYEDVEFLIELLKNVDPLIKCEAFVNGIQLLNYLNQCINLPDYIIMDIYMPKMNGCECLMELHKIERYKPIPIIIYSGNLDSNNWDMKYCKNLGVLYFLNKSDVFQKSSEYLKGVLATV